MPEPSPSILFFLARAFPCGLLCQHVIDHRHSPFPFVDIAKLRTKKMRSNLLKRIQKQNSESPSKNRNYWYQTFCKSETKSETSSGIPLKRSPGLMHRSPSIYKYKESITTYCHCHFVAFVFFIFRGKEDCHCKSYILYIIYIIL